MENLLWVHIGCAQTKVQMWWDSFRNDQGGNANGDIADPKIEFEFVVRNGAELQESAPTVLTGQELTFKVRYFEGESGRMVASELVPTYSVQMP